MDQTFNPYAQWLGLPESTERPDHYSLLGLPQFESDPAKIKQAADKAVARVRSFRPGDKAKYWAGLLDELDAVRKCLADAEAKAAYDEQLKQGGPAADPASAPAPMPEQPRYGPAGPAPDGSSESLAPAKTPSGDPSLYAPGFVASQSAATLPSSNTGPLPVRPPGRVPMSRDDDLPANMKSDIDPMAPVTIPSSVDGASAQATATAPMATPVGNNPVPVATAAPQATATSEDNKSKANENGSNNQLLYAGIGAAAALALGIAGLVMFWPEDPNTGANAVVTSKATPDPDVSEIEEPPFVPPPEEEPEPTPEIEVPPVPEFEPEPEPTPEPEPEPEVTPDPPTPEPEPEPTPEPEPPVDTTPPTPMPPDPVPEPEPEPVPTDVPQTAADKADLNKALIAARTAMGDRDLPTTEKNLAAAEALARTDEQKAKVERLKELKYYVQEFWTSVDEAYVNLKPSTTIQVGTGEVAIVEVTADRLVVRSFGTNRRFPRDELPSGLAMAIANNWFDDNPTNKVVKGALLLVDPNGRPEETRDLWRQAQAAGVDIAELMPVIDDKYEF